MGYMFCCNATVAKVNLITHSPPCLQQCQCLVERQNGAALLGAAWTLAWCSRQGETTSDSLMQ